MSILACLPVPPKSSLALVPKGRRFGYRHHAGSGPSRSSPPLVFKTTRRRSSVEWPLPTGIVAGELSHCETDFLWAIELLSYGECLEVIFSKRKMKITECKS